MVKSDIIAGYELYCHKLNQLDHRDQVYQLVAKHYHIKSALYPGCYIDIAPSLWIPKVTYVDNFKKAAQFFKALPTIMAFLNQHKAYSAPCTISFISADYNQPLAIEPVDLLISQYAGFVSRATKQYLKPNGILLANDSHGDATLAFHDPEFKLIGVVKIINNHQGVIDATNLEQYFQLRSQSPLNWNQFLLKKKGPDYKVKASNYLFIKVSSIKA